VKVFLFLKERGTFLDFLLSFGQKKLLANISAFCSKNQEVEMLRNNFFQKNITDIF
jgi:hypothetical protein